MVRGFSAALACMLALGGVDVRARDASDGRTLLHTAASHGGACRAGPASHAPAAHSRLACGQGWALPPRPLAFRPHSAASPPGLNPANRVEAIRALPLACTLQTVLRRSTLFSSPVPRQM